MSYWSWICRSLSPLIKSPVLVINYNNNTIADSHKLHCSWSRKGVGKNHFFIQTSEKDWNLFQNLTYQSDFPTGWWVWGTHYRITTIQWCGTLTLFSFFQYLPVSTRQTWHLYLFWKPHMIRLLVSQVGGTWTFKNRRTESHFCYCHPLLSGHGA